MIQHFPYLCFVNLFSLNHATKSILPNETGTKNTRGHFISVGHKKNPSGHRQYQGEQKNPIPVALKPIPGTKKNKFLGTRNTDRNGKTPRGQKKNKSGKNNPTGRKNTIPGTKNTEPEAEAQMCPKYCFLHIFLLSSVLGLCKKRGNTRIFGCYQKRCNLHRFLALQWSKLRYIQGFVWPCALGCSLMESEESFKTPLFTRLCHFSHPRACKLVFGIGIHLTSLSLFEVPSSEQSALLGLRAILGYKMEAPGTCEPHQNDSFKLRRLLSQFLV